MYEERVLAALSDLVAVEASFSLSAMHIRQMKISLRAVGLAQGGPGDHLPCFLEALETPLYKIHEPSGQFVVFSNNSSRVTVPNGI